MSDQTEIKTAPLADEERRIYEVYAGMGSAVRKMVEHTERLIAKAVVDERERIATALEAKIKKPVWERDIYVNDGLRDAAKIARKAPK